MSDKISVEVYIASAADDPRTLKIGDRSILDLIEDANRVFGDEKASPSLVLRSVTETECSLSKFSSMDWSAEKRFRERLVGLCVIDGRHFRKFMKEVFTIRGHHFPPFEDYPGYCFLFPEVAASESLGNAESVGAEPTVAEAIALLEREFRCKLVEPSEKGFKTFVRALRMLNQLHGATLEAFFDKEQ